jgi:hypothetical protein
MQAAYEPYTTKATLDKAVNSLLGILEGVSLDGVINPDEITYLSAWLKSHQQYEHRHPFNELLPVISNALIDNELTEEERSNITWLCQNLRSTTFYDEISADLQRLQGIMSGIASDQLVSVDELNQLSDWLSDHEHLRTRYPFDEMDSLIISILKDRKIDSEENKLLLTFLNDFSPLPNVITGEVAPPTLQGICAICPEIAFEGSRFCFTGESEKFTREQLANLATERGGKVVSGVSKKLNYLVVGSAGNPYWKYACYGRKIEQVMELRKAGAPIVIVHENDFHDALA